MKFVRFDETTGRIIQVGEVPETMLSLQGTNVIPGDATLDSHYVDLASKTLIALPEKPGPNYFWDFSGKAIPDRHLLTFARKPLTVQRQMKLW